MKIEFSKKYPEYVKPDVVTTTEDGLMLPTDLVKLNGINSNATNFTDTMSPGTSLTKGLFPANQYGKLMSIASVAKKTTLATESENGLMTVTDKVKLDTIESGGLRTWYPIGTIVLIHKNAIIPTGWMECNGSVYLGDDWVTYSGSTSLPKIPYDVNPDYKFYIKVIVK